MMFRTSDVYLKCFSCNTEGFEPALLVSLSQVKQKVLKPWQTNFLSFQLILQLKIDALKLEQLLLLWRSMRTRRAANCRWYECKDKRFTEECRRHREALREGPSELFAERCRLMHLSTAMCIFSSRFVTPWVSAQVKISSMFKETCGTR